MRAEAPDHDGPGEGFHQAVQAEAGEGDAAGQIAGQQGGQGLQEVIADGEVGQDEGVGLGTGGHRTGGLGRGSLTAGGGSRGLDLKMIVHLVSCTPYLPSCPGKRWISMPFLVAIMVGGAHPTCLDPRQGEGGYEGGEAGAWRIMAFPSCSLGTRLKRPKASPSLAQDDRNSYFAKGSEDSMVYFSSSSKRSSKTFMAQKRPHMVHWSSLARLRSR